VEISVDFIVQNYYIDIILY